VDLIFPQHLLISISLTVYRLWDHEYSKRTVIKLIWLSCRIAVPVLYSMEFHGETYEIFQGDSVGFNGKRRVSW